MSSISAVIVTFNTGNKYFDNFLTIVHQVDNIIIVDNGSNQETVNTLSKIKLDYPNVIIIYNKENLGLAKAQNIGFDKAIELKSQWVLMLDDDSRAAPDMVKSMVSFYNKHKEPEKLAIIGPNIKEVEVDSKPLYYGVNNKPLKLRQEFKSEEYIEVFFVIASGSLIKVDIYQKIGKFREDFFIDYIDIEYGLRVCSLGYQVIVIKDAILYHRLGNKKTHKFLNLIAISFNHNALRKYYIYRNRIKVWKLYISKFPIFILYDIASAFFHLLKIIFLEKNKFSKIIAVFKGVKAGFFEKI
ncbi:MAG: glycosyltransferase family 2 protein [Alphaproteobacteria bacterium]